MTPPRIAILGANGQVGSELALLLAGSAAAEVRGVVRAEYGAALLRLAEIPHAVAGFDDTEALGRAVGDADLVVDLTYPGGQFVEIPAAIERNTAAVMDAMRRGARYLQMSSIMAFGMASGDSTVRDHRVPRASYGHIKRWAEGKAIQLGRARGIDTFPCRLGQVHGVLQSVTHEYRSRIRAGGLCFVGAPDSLSTTLFTNTVADAVLACARGALEPERVHTLVSNPQWPLAELGEAYRSLHAPEVEVTYQAPAPARARLPGLDLARGLVAGAPARDLLETHVLLRAPELFVRAKGMFRVRAVRAEAAALGQRSGGSSAAAPIPCLVGAVPGPLVPGIDSSLETTLRVQRELAARFDAVLEKGRK